MDQMYSCMEKQMFQKKMFSIMKYILPIDQCINNTFVQLASGETKTYSGTHI